MSQGLGLPLCLLALWGPTTCPPSALGQGSKHKGRFDPEPSRCLHTQSPDSTGTAVTHRSLGPGAFLLFVSNFSELLNFSGKILSPL